MLTREEKTKRNYDNKWSKRPQVMLLENKSGQPFREYNDRKKDRKAGKLKHSELLKYREQKKYDNATQ